MEVLHSFDAHSVDEREARRLETLRKQMREQDARRFRDPEARSPLVGLYVLYVWRKQKWILLSFERMKPVPSRLRRWRKRYKVQDEEMVRVVDLRSAQRHGAGAAPQEPPRSRRPSRLARLNTKLKLVVAVPEPEPRTKRPRVDPRLSLCDHGKGSQRTRCGRRAPWYVGYRSARTGGRVIKCRCTRHAWNDKFLPDGVTHVLRVAREVRR